MVDVEVFLKFERLLQLPIAPVAKHYNLGKLLAMGLKKDLTAPKHWAIPVNVHTPPIKEFDTPFDSYPHGQFNYFHLHVHRPWTNDNYTSIPRQRNGIIVCHPRQKKQNCFAPLDKVMIDALPLGRMHYSTR